MLSWLIFDDKRCWKSIPILQNLFLFQRYLKASSEQVANEWNVALHSSSSTGGERVRIWETVAPIYSFRPSLLYTPASLDVKPIKALHSNCSKFGSEWVSQLKSQQNWLLTFRCPTLVSAKHLPTAYSSVVLVHCCTRFSVGMMLRLGSGWCFLWKTLRKWPKLFPRLPQINEIYILQKNSRK